MDCFVCERAPADHAQSLAHGFQPVCSTACGAALIGAPRRGEEKRERDRALELTPLRDALEQLLKRTDAITKQINEMYQGYTDDQSLPNALDKLYVTHRRLPQAIAAPLDQDEKTQRVAQAVSRAVRDLVGLDLDLKRDLDKDNGEAVTPELVVYRYRSLREIMRRLSDSVVLGTEFDFTDNNPQYMQLAQLAYADTAPLFKYIQPQFIAYHSYRGELVIALATAGKDRRLARYAIQSGEIREIARKQGEVRIADVRAIMLNHTNDQLVVLYGDLAALKIEFRNWNTLDRIGKPISLPAGESGASVRLLRDADGSVVLYTERRRFYAPVAASGSLAVIGEMRGSLYQDRAAPRPLVGGLASHIQVLAYSNQNADGKTVTELLVSPDESFASLRREGQKERSAWSAELEGEVFTAVMTERGGIAAPTLAVGYRNHQGDAAIQLFDAFSGQRRGFFLQRNAQSGAKYEQLLFERNQDGLTLSVLLRNADAGQLLLGRIML